MILQYFWSLRTHSHHTTLFDTPLYVLISNSRIIQTIFFPPIWYSYKNIHLALNEISVEKFTSFGYSVTHILQTLRLVTFWLNQQPLPEISLTQYYFLKSYLDEKWKCFFVSVSSLVWYLPKYLNFFKN